MLTNNEKYIALVTNWIEKRVIIPIDFPIPEVLKPLELALQGKKDDSLALIQSMKDLHDDDFYLLETRIFNLSTRNTIMSNICPENLDLAKDILERYPTAIIANLYMANHYYRKGYWIEILDYLKNVFSQIPNSDSLRVKIIYTSILAQDSYHARCYLPLVMNKKEKFFCWLGVYGMSSKYQRIAVTVILAIFSFFYPYVLYLFIPTLFFFLYWYLLWRKKESPIIPFVSKEYVKLMAGWSILSFIVHGIFLTF